MNAYLEIFVGSLAVFLLIAVGGILPSAIYLTLQAKQEKNRDVLLGGSLMLIFLVVLMGIAILTIFSI